MIRYGGSILACALPLLLAAGAAAAQQGSRVAGTFHVTWGDTFDPAVPHLELPTLLADDGRAYLLDVPAAVLAAHGGAFALAGRRVALRVDAQPAVHADGGGPAGMPRLSVRAIEQAHGAPRFDAQLLLEPALAAAPAVQRLPYATLLCRYADRPDVEPRPAAYYEEIMSGAYPNTGHFWSHVSGGRLSLEGSRTFGWYTLPHPEAHYVRPGDFYANLYALMDDCMAAADADVRFPAFEGIVVQVNGSVGVPRAFATSGFSDRDGVARRYLVSVMGDQADRAVYIHEIGHNLGLPHSSGWYGQEYDSRWDVMSNGSWATAPAGDATGVHTIAAYQHWLGWTPEAHRFVAPAGRSSLTLDALRGAGQGNPQLAIVPLADGHVYTIEARRREGYDTGVPADAVIIHHIRGSVGRAYLVDADGNGNPNDDGATWRVGDIFRDRARGVEITVDAETEHGFALTIHTPALDSVSVLAAPHRREVAFGSTLLLRDSAYVRVVGPNASHIHWTASASAGLELEAASGAGSGWLRWRRLTAGMAAGEHVEWINLASGAAVAVTTEVADTLVVAAPPERAAGFARPMATDTLLAGQGRADDWMGSSAVLSISGPGASEAAWSITRRPAWLAVEPASGTGNAALFVSRSAAGMAPGTYVDTLRVEVEGAARPALLVHRLVVLAPLEIAPQRASLSARVPEGSESGPDSVYVELRGAWAASAVLRVAATSPTRTIDAQRVGSGWVRFHRSTMGRGPGSHAGELKLWLAHDHDAEMGVTLADTVQVDAAPAAIALVRAGGVDTVHVGEWSESSALVRPQGAGSTVHAWYPQWKTSRTTMLNWYGAEYAPPRGPQVGPMSLRWARNLSNRSPGLNVDTIHIRYADGPPVIVALLDSLWVIGPPPAAPPLVIGSDSVRPAGRMGAAYTDTLRVGGADGDVRWRLADGALPPGLALDSVAGRVAGVPEAAGSWHFTLEAASGARSVSRGFQLRVEKPVLQPAAVLDRLLGGGALSADEVRFLDLLGNRNGRLDVGDVRAWLLDADHLSAEQAAALRALVDPAEPAETPTNEPREREP